MAVVVKAVSVLNLPLYAPDRQVHPGHAPRGVVGFLAEDGDVAPGPTTIAISACMCLDELIRLDKHARRAAAGVIDPAFVWLQHLHKQPDHRARRVELSTLPALGQCELLQKVLVDVTEHIRGPGLCAAHLDVAHHIDYLPQAGLVQGGSGVVLGQHVLEHRVIPFDGRHCIVNQPTDGGLTGLALERLPPSLARNPEDTLGTVLIWVLGVGALILLRFQLYVGFLEGIGDVLEENQTENDVLVLGASMLPRRASAILQYSDL